MKNSKSGQPGLNRLSELPDSLILIILSFLPMRDVVKTTLLSKRWKDLWITVPCLNFSDDAKAISNKFRNFVNRAMIHWKGTKILKFDVDFIFDRSYASDLDMWLRIAMQKGVEELHINLMDPAKNSVSCEYSAPRRLLSYSSIRKLSLVNCDLGIKRNVQWDQLKCLTIDRICLTEEAMNQVLSGAPQLEVLILKSIESYGNLNIKSSRLKTLTLNIEKGKDRYSGIDTELTIWAPDVGRLEISGVPFSKYMLMDVSSLTEAGAWRDKKKKKDMIASLSNAKVLELYATRVSEVVDLLEIFPKLTSLVLQQELQEFRGIHFFGIRCHSTEPFVSKFDAENSMESKTDILMHHLPHLKTVEIAWDVHDSSIFSFIEILSKNVGKLEKTVLCVTEIESPIPLWASDSLFLAANKLLSVQKSFPTAEVIMCKY